MQKFKTILAYSAVLFVGIMIGQCDTEPETAAVTPTGQSQQPAPIEPPARAAPAPSPPAAPVQPVVLEAEPQGLGISVREYEAQLAELDLAVDMDFSPLGDGTPRWIGNSGVVIVELQGSRNDLTRIYVMAGFVKDDLGATAESLLWLTTVISATLPFEQRKPVADWMLGQIGQIENLPEDEAVEASYAAGDLRFDWQFIPILGSASLSVERAPEEGA